MLDLNQRQIAWNNINLAKRYLDTDPHLANFVLRDLDATKEAGLSDLAWAGHRDGNLHKNDVKFLIELLEKHLLEYDEVSKA